MAKPTEKQIDELRSLGLDDAYFPKTSANAYLALSYLRDGTKTEGATRADRVAIYKGYFNKWVGARVEMGEEVEPGTFDRGKGRVIGLLARSAVEARCARMRRGKLANSEVPVHAFKLIVVWDHNFPKNNAQIVRMSRVRKIEE